jgi:putative tryptophan/tyrosine transport system substrate-binding protein
MEGHNIVSEYRSAERQLKSLPALSMELVQLKVDLIVADGSIETRAAEQATSTIPIVMIAPVEAVKTRLVASLMFPWRKIGRS